ncbi:pyruvate carboxyltransferase [Desulfovibrio ferrophilus]|uniref:Pyruvate carboxyltransferase n=1 Tax=Desulfovibrio ferrophilus TaxID=241368 RepID=A0A2Z6AYA1_9BACT|nr:pyruvate carboxyltransferase [Desulfovibrio ferrophilus]BBD08219.1 pyruvate carboxyltransferase [Desulfovibrio ferrophilus]
MLIDTTLREGAQTYGVTFDNSACRELIKTLATAGIEEIEAGWAGQKELGELLSWARGLVGNTALSVWARLKAVDIDLAAAAGADRLNIGVPVSDAHLGSRLGTTRDKLLLELRELIPLARNRGFGYVSIGLEDASRADMGFLLQVARRAAELGADRVRIADTVGIMDPSAMMELTTTLRNIFPAHIAVHCHDDFGMATANAVSALRAGADFADVSVLGIGERTGVSRLEEVASFMSLRSADKRYDLSAIRKACRMVEELADIAVPRNKPICGRDIFACESGLHVDGLLKAPALYEPFPPEAVGQTSSARRIEFGTKSGRSAVGAALKQLGRAGNPGNLSALTEAVRDAARDLGRPLTKHEVADALGA